MIMKRYLQLTALLGSLAALFALANRGAAEGGDELTAGAMGLAPSWDLPLVGGDRLSSDDLAGKFVVIDFWATWCPPCRAEIPDYVELQEAFGDKGVVFVGVSLDQGASADAKVQKFIEEYKVNYPIVMGDAKMVEAFGGIESIPTTFLIDREGQIVRRKVGYRPKSYLEDILSELL
jgi:thiol-disulfide isomerase/thioredoxin